MPSRRAAACQPLIRGFSSAGGGAVSVRNCSTAAMTAAASVSEATGETNSMRCRAGVRLPLELMACTLSRGKRYEWPVPPVAVLGYDTVLAAVPATAAIAATRAAFERHANGEWRMPPKIYVDAPPNGDFRAMPAIGDGIAILKWVTSFPQNAARGYPAVAGALLVSNADTRQLLAVLHRPARLHRRHRRAPGRSRLRGRDLASHRRRRRGLLPGAGAGRGANRRPRRLRCQRRLGGAMPRGGRLRPGRLL